MKSIYLLLTRSDSLLSRTIQRFTDDPYTHVSIAFDRKLSPLYSFSRKYADVPLPAGLVTEHLHKGLFERQHGMPCALLELKVEDDAYIKAKQIVEKMMRRPDVYRYNLLGLVFCRLAIPFERRHYYFCSQFVGKVLLYSGAAVLPKPVSLMRPVDYDLMPGITCLFRGQLASLYNGVYIRPKLASFERSVYYNNDTYSSYIINCQ
jgi:hypothetical protein